MMLHSSLNALLSDKAISKKLFLMCILEWAIAGFVMGYTITLLTSSASTDSLANKVGLIAAIGTSGMMFILRKAVVSRNPDLALLIIPLVLCVTGAVAMVA